MKTIIERHGGLVSDYHECFTYQIAPLNIELTKNYYFWGEVYNAHWLVDSIREGTLQEKASYFEYFNKEKGIKRVELGVNKPKYTITEAIKIFEIALANRNSARGASFWIKIERENFLPKRSADSMRNFWKSHMNTGLENYMKNALEDNVRYCHAFINIPKVKVASSVTSAVEDRVFEQAKLGII